MILKRPNNPRAHTWVRPYVVNQTIAFVRYVWCFAVATRCHPERSEAKRNEVEGSPDVRQKRLFIAEGDLSTILLRKIASGTAEDDNYKRFR